MTSNNEKNTWYKVKTILSNNYLNGEKNLV